MHAARPEKLHEGSSTSLVKGETKAIFFYDFLVFRRFGGRGTTHTSHPQLLLTDMKKRLSHSLLQSSFQATLPDQLVQHIFFPPF